MENPKTLFGHYELIEWGPSFRVMMAAAKIFIVFTAIDFCVQHAMLSFTCRGAAGELNPHRLQLIASGPNTL